MAVSLFLAKKPLFFTLYMLGLYCFPVKNSNKYIRLLNHFLNYVLGILLTVLFCGTLIVSAVRVIRLSLSLENILFLYQASYLLGEVFIAVVFRFCCQKSFRAFFVELQSYRQKHAQIDVCYKSILILGTIAILSNISYLCYSVHYLLTTTNFNQICHLMFSPFEINFVTAIFCHTGFAIVAVFVSQQIYCVLFLTYLSVWRLLQMEANAIFKTLTKLDSSTVNDQPEVLEAIRLRHADLCHVTASANQFIRHFLAAYFGAGLCCVLLVIHGLLRGDLTFHALVGMASSTIPFLVYMIVLTLTGVSLNMKMHEPVDYLFRFDVLRMTGRGAEVVSTFLSRVQGAPIGFNVYNLFTVDTSAILMMCGTLLTYALVIAQFPQSNGATQGPGASTDHPLPVTSAYTDQPDLVNATELWPKL